MSLCNFNGSVPNHPKQVDSSSHNRQRVLSRFLRRASNRTNRRSYIYRLQLHYSALTTEAEGVHIEEVIGTSYCCFIAWWCLVANVSEKSIGLKLRYPGEEAIFDLAIECVVSTMAPTVA